MHVLNHMYLVKQEQHRVLSKHTRWMSNTLEALPCSPRTMANPNEGGHSDQKHSRRLRAQFWHGHLRGMSYKSPVSLLPPPPWHGPTPKSATAAATAAVTRMGTTATVMTGNNLISVPRRVVPMSNDAYSGSGSESSTGRLHTRTSRWYKPQPPRCQRCGVYYAATRANLANDTRRLARVSSGSGGEAAATRTTRVFVYHSLCGGYPIRAMSVFP